MHARVYGEGASPADVLVLADMPGPEEARLGRPLIGRAGRELRRHFNGYTIPRKPSDVYLSNLSKTPAKDVKSMTFSSEDEQDLWTEIEMVRPKYILTCGARVTHYFLGDDVTLEMVHGIPHAPIVKHHDGFYNLFGEDRLPIILPTYNPAAALYAPALQSQFAYDLQRFGLLLKGQLPPAPVDLLKGTYTLVDDVPDQQLGTLTDIVAVDTEGWTWNPWGLSYSAVPYYGGVARRDSEGLKNFFRFLAAIRPDVVLHNSLHDIGVIRALGCDLEAADLTIHDTMVMAYLLGLEPQGLKPLAYRHAGMTHQDYSDVVAEPNARIAFEWLAALHDRLPSAPEKLTKKALKALAAQGVPVPAPLPPEQEPLAKAKKLIGAMLGKDSERSLRARWADGRAREILTDESNFLQEYEADPPEATLDEVPLDVAVNYSGRDADATIRIYPTLSKSIDAFGLRDVYETDMAIVPMIERMQTTGLLADLEHFKSLSLMLAEEQRINAEDLRRATKRDVNPNSGDQVAELLFDEMRLHLKAGNLKIKRTESGSRLTTNDKVLEALADVDDTGIVTLITEGREIQKIKGTFCDPMPRLLGRDGRLHPQYRITRTDTGRLSAASPNVLAFPKHSKRGKLVRDGFVAAPGHVLGEWDFDQIEMRVFAHDSHDERLIAEFLSGLDKHAQTAAMMYQRDVHELIKEYKGGFGEGEHQRFTAKALNFGILMGITAHGLLAQLHKAGQLHWTLEQTQALLDTWLASYPQAADYIQTKHAEARRYGFVRDMWGRLRWLEGIHAADDYIRAEAERQAQATPTQSGAQGIIKRAMRLLWPILRDFRQQGMYVECLLQIHDALILEFDERDREIIDATVMAVFNTAVELAVPTTAKSKFGARWGDL